MPALEGGAFLQGNVGQGLVVIGQGANLGGAGGGEVFCQLKNNETGAFAVLEFFLFGLESGFSIDAGFSSGADGLEIRVHSGDGIFDGNESILSDLLELEFGLLPFGSRDLVAVAGR